MVDAASSSMPSWSTRLWSGLLIPGMALSPDDDTFLVESHVPLPETELEILSDSVPVPIGLESPLLDDFQLDLELECEDDDFMAIDNGQTNSWNNDAMPVHLFGPVQNSQARRQTYHSFHHQNQSVRNPTIAELIKSKFIDRKGKKEESFTVNNPILMGTPEKTHNGETIQVDRFKSCLPATSSCKSELTSCSVSRDISQSCVICPVCRILFSNFNALQSHFLDQHSKVKPEPESNECSSRIKTQSYTKKKFTKQRKNLTRKRNESLDPFYCKMCSYSNKRKRLLHQHVKSKHNVNREFFVCDLCPFSCVQERSFKIHKLKHGEGEEGKFACDQCGKLFYTMGILKRHARTHNSVRTYACDFQNCKKAFTIKSRLTDHKKTVHGKKFIHQRTVTGCLKSSDSHRNETLTEKIFLNETADLLSKINELFTTVSQSDNAKAESSSQGQFCDQQKSNNNVTCVYDIILPETENGNPSVDDVCSQSADLLQADINSTLTPLSKSSAQPASTDRTVLYSETKISPGKKQFQCSWAGCGKRFRDNFNLKKHMCTHTGEMENACPLCRYRCIQKSALDKHMKTHKKP